MIGNPLTQRVETYMGVIFVSVFAFFCLGFLFVSYKNFNSDVDTLSSNSATVRIVSATEKELIDQWLKKNHIEVPDGKGYRYLLQKYPSRPWI